MQNVYPIKIAYLVQGMKSSENVRISVWKWLHSIKKIKVANLHVSKLQILFKDINC